MTDEPQRGIIEEEDLWSWIDPDTQEQSEPAIDPNSVTAVMVVRDAEPWLARQLLALTRLAPRPGRLIVVDAGSIDGSVPLLQAAAKEGVIDELKLLDEPVSFGAAVENALAGDIPEWLWLLHDDSSPHRDALAHLLEGARQSDVVTPKLLEPKRRNYPETLCEVGQAITRSGHHVALVDRGDIDQNHLEPRDVLGASTAGLLIRREVWEELGGLAPEVERHRNGIDFCWRANAVGFRVLAWPAAALNHRRAGHTGERRCERHPHEDDRLAALRVAGARGASGISLATSTAVRSLGFLLAKSPGHAAAELKAWKRFRASAEITQSLAKRLPIEDKTPADLVPGRWVPFKQALDHFGAGITERYRDFAEPSTSIDELTGDEYANSSDTRHVVSPLAVFVGVFLAAALIAGRSLYSSGTVAGGGLLPPPSSLAQAWQAYLAGNSPWLGFAAVGSLLGLGNPGWAVVISLLLAPLAAGLSLLRTLRHFSVDRFAASVAAAIWAAATVMLGLVTGGDISGLVLAVVAPPLMRACHRLLKNDSVGAERLRAPAFVAWWLILATVVWPLFLPVATAAAAYVVWRKRLVLVDALVALVPVWLFIITWLPTLVLHPGRWLTGVDPLAWSEPTSPSWAILFGRIIASGLPAWSSAVFVTVLALVAVVALSAAERVVQRNCIIALAVVVVSAVVLSKLALPVEGGYARALLSPFALAAVAVLLVPVVLHHRDHEITWSRSLTALSLVSALAAGTWAVTGFAGPVQPNATVLPGYVRDVINSARNTRALLIDMSGEDIKWNVVDARHPQWGTGEQVAGGAFTEELAGIVGVIAGATPPETLAQDLTGLGISHIWIRGFTEDQQDSLNNVAGLLGASADENAAVWTVGGLVSRTYLVTGDQAQPLTTGTIPAPTQGLLRVAEPPNAQWIATVGGKRLAKAVDGQRLAFTLDGQTGEVRIEPVNHPLRVAGQLALLAIIALLAAPTMGATTAARRGQE